MYVLYLEAELRLDNTDYPVTIQNSFMYAEHFRRLLVKDSLYG